MRKNAEPTTAITVSFRQRAATKRNMAIPSVCSRKRNRRKVKNLHGAAKLMPWGRGGGVSAAHSRFVFKAKHIDLISGSRS